MEFNIIGIRIKKSFNLKRLRMSRIKNNSGIFSLWVCILKFDRAYLHHDSGKRSRKVKESVKKAAK